MSGHEHLTYRELADIHADPEVTRRIGQMVADGEIALDTAVEWLQDDLLARGDRAVHEE